MDRGGLAHQNDVPQYREGFKWLSLLENEGNLTTMKEVEPLRNMR